MGSSAMMSSLPKLALATAVALLVTVPVAQADERDDYVAAVEPICKANTKANGRILKGVKGQVRKGRLRPAGRRFIRASAALGRTIKQIARVPRPEADAARLTKWIRYLIKQRRFLRLIGKALKAHNKFRAQKLAVKLNRNNNQANNTIIAFNFRHCRIDSSRFI